MLGGIIGRIREGKRVEEMEAELPWLLRSIGIELDMGSPFEKAIAQACRDGGALNAEFRSAAREMEGGGSSAQEALGRLAERCKSLAIRRAVSELVHCYENGEKGDGLKRLAAELAQAGKSRVKEYAGRVSLIGLAFIAVSCIVPSLFLAFAIVGSSFTGALLSPVQMWLAFVVVFPLIGAALLLLAWFATPAGMRLAKGGGVFGEAEVRHINGLLKARGVRVDAREMALPAFCASSLFAASAYFALEGAGADIAVRLVAALTLLSAPLFAYFFLANLVRGRGAKMEQFLPDALFQASSMQRGVGFERLVAAIARSGYGPLSEEFAAAHRQIKAGVGVVPALEGIAQRCDSILVQRAIGLLAQAYRSGADMGWAMREAAEDSFEMFSALWERKAMLAVQRYTVLFGALLAPLVLGLITNAISGLDFSGVEGMGVPASERAALLGAAVGAAEAYIALFALLASIFAAMQEGEWKRFVLGFAVLAPAGLAVFGAARAYGI